MCKYYYYCSLALLVACVYSSGWPNSQQHLLSIWPAPALASSQGLCERVSEDMNWFGWFGAPPASSIEMTTCIGDA